MVQDKADITTHLVETDKYTIRELEPGLLETVIKNNATIESRDAWEIKKYNLKISNNKPYVVLVTSGHLSSVSRGAREVVASKEYVGNTIAKALLVESLGHRIVGNFYLAVNKPFIKTRMFTEREEALAWLRKELNT